MKFDVVFLMLLGVSRLRMACGNSSSLLGVSGDGDRNSLRDCLHLLLLRLDTLCIPGVGWAEMGQWCALHSVLVVLLMIVLQCPLIFANFLRNRGDIPIYSATAPAGCLDVWRIPVRPILVIKAIK